MCVIARVNRAFRTLALPYIYNIVDLSALPTLLSCPDLLKHVDMGALSWQRGRQEPQTGTLRKLGKTDQPLTLTPEQASRYQVSKELQEELL
jgi:hypothetical protein